MIWRNLKKRTSILIALLLLALLLAIIAAAGGGMENAFDEENVRMAEDTVRKYAVQCYALEGSYPESLGYLTEHYTLVLNKDKYVYHYDYIGGNMMPDISVFPIEK